MFGSNNRKPKKTRKILTETISTLALIVIAATGLYSAQLNPVQVLLLGGALFMSGFVLVVALVYQPSLIIIRQKILYRKRNRAAKKYFEEFIGFFDNFLTYVTDSGSNIPYTLRNIQRGHEEFTSLSIPHVGYLYSLVDSFKSLFNHSDTSAENFYWFTEIFDDLLRVFHRFYFEDIPRQIERIGKEKVPERLRGEFNGYRAIYCILRENYKKFIENVNREVGEELLKTHYYQPPLPL